MNHVAELDDEEPRLKGPAPLRKQFADLLALSEGWFEPGTPALNKSGLASVQGFITTAVALGVPVPYLYPTPDGEARAEWSLGRWEVSATFDLIENVGRLHATHLDSDTTEEGDLAVGGADAVATFSHFVGQFLSDPPPIPE